MPDALAALAQLGVVPSDTQGSHFRGIRFVEDGSAAEAHFPADLHGFGIRRIELHRLLIERAEAVGVTMRWNSSATLVGDRQVRSGDDLIRCEWIIGADGQNSRVREAAQLGRVWSSRHRIAQRLHFRLEPWTDCVEVHWRDHCQAYVTPVGPRTICVALVGDGPAIRMTNLATLFPALRRRLAQADPTSSIRGSVTGSRHLRRVVRGRIALVGDASGSVDAITGDGLGLAFRQTLALAKAIEQRDLARYARAHRRIGRMPRLMARLMLGLGSRAGLRRRALNALASNPQIFDRLLAIHVGAIQPATASLDFANFAWRLLASAPSAQY